MWLVYSGRMRRATAILIALALAATAGCASYDPKPIEPARTEAALGGRSLADPGLRAFVARHTVTPTAEWPLKSWDLERLTLASFYYHSDLDVARARVRIAEGAIVTAGGMPNPNIALGGAYTTAVDAGSMPWTYGFTLDIPIETAGKRGKRTDRAEHDAEAARLALGEAAWKVRSRLRAALVEHLLATAESELLASEERLRSEVQGLVERRFAAGAASAVELHTARSEAAAARLAARGSEGRVAESRAALEQAVGVGPGALAGTAIEWRDLTRPPPAASLPLGRVRRAGLLNRLDVRRGLEEYAAAEAALRLEVAKQWPDVHLNPGYQYDQSQNHIQLGITIDLPILNQNQGPIAEAEARREESAALFQALQAGVLGELEQARARYVGSAAELGEADRVLEEREANARAAERAFELGGADRVDLAVARVDLAAARRARVDALRRAQAALGLLEDAVEAPLASVPPPPEPTLENPRHEAAREGRP